MVSNKLGEREGEKCQVLISLYLCSTHPDPFQKKKKKSFKKIKIGRSRQNDERLLPPALPGRRVRGGPAPVALSVGPFVLPQLLK